LGGGRRSGLQIEAKRGGKREKGGLMTYLGFVTWWAEIGREK